MSNKNLGWARIINPLVITFVASLALLIGTLIKFDGDPLALARLGEQYSLGKQAAKQDPNLSKGYDGQFVYYIARYLEPTQVAEHLDVPAYRYQRILYPLLARMLSFGNLELLPWVLLVINLAFHMLGTWAFGKLMFAWGINRWYALVYGCWVGFLLALIVDLPEPIAYGLVTCSFLALEHGKKTIGWLLLCFALFAKEVTILFALALLISYLFHRDWKSAAYCTVTTFMPFIVFQLWLWMVFGQPGVGSGGDMATSFELIPFMGILRIGSYSMLYLLGMLVVFGPTILWPTIWGVWKSLKFLALGNINVLILSLLFNCLMIVFLPFSTFRETGGLMRLACGLVTAMLLFLGKHHQTKALNYSWIWLVLNVFIFKS